jgi:ATP-dependent RNA helicase RhlE
VGDLHDNTDRTGAARAGGRAGGKGAGRDRRAGGDARRGEVRRDDTRRSEARRSEARRDEARPEDARRTGQVRRTPDKAKRTEAAKKIRAMFEPKL